MNAFSISNLTHVGETKIHRARIYDVNGEAIEITIEQPTTERDACLEAAARLRAFAAQFEQIANQSI